MEELDKWKAVNICENFGQLNDIFNILCPLIYSSGKLKNEQEMQIILTGIRAKVFPVNYMTRNYGLRSKVLYLLYYEEV